MDIRSDRIARDIEIIASFSECEPGVGYSRPTFSAAWVGARDYVIAEATALRCKVRIDAAGNVHLRPGRFGWEKPLWLSGSHIDSVPTGGKYDGVVGVVVPLEVMRANPQAPMELIIFAEEEGTTFNLGMLGSRTWAGTLGEVQLAKLRNRHGLSYLAAGEPYGVHPALFGTDQVSPRTYQGLIEVHVEQGISMWNTGTPVAVVTAINGRRQFRVTLAGEANHAGSTKMPDRHDALAGAAEAIVALEALGRRLHAELDHTVVTVGWMKVSPNALNVIPGEVQFRVDLRARTDAMLDRGEREVLESVKAVAGRRGLSCEVERTEALPAVPMDGGVIEALRAGARTAGVTLPEVTSGALHDAAILAPILPTAMLFVASEGGISHNPKEYSRIEDIALAARILGEAVSA